MYLGLVVRYDISYSVNQLTRALPKSSKSHMAVTKHLLRYLAETTDFSVRYKQGGFNLTTFLGANWGNNSDNGNSRSSYLIFLASAPISFTVAARANRARGHSADTKGGDVLLKYDQGARI